jgi:hypothetical protein
MRCFVPGAWQFKSWWERNLSKILVWQFLNHYFWRAIVWVIVDAVSTIEVVVTHSESKHEKMSNKILLQGQLMVNTKYYLYYNILYEIRDHCYQN